MDQPGTRIQWGQALVVLSMIVLSWWTATQWTAWELAFQPELGRPWFTVLHRWPVYAPPLFFWWWYEFDAYAPAVFARGAWIAGSGGVLAFAAAVALSVHRAREAKRAATYGSARWAEDAEIRVVGLLGEDGVVLGKYRRAYLRHDGPEHVLTFAPTRSGKGVGMVVPTLLTWPGSAIIHDIKGENWQITAGFRAIFGRVLLFDPTNPASSAYNPLLEVRRGVSEVRDVQNIADILVDPEGSLERRNHWEKTSHALLVGAILHVLYAEDDKTLAGVAKFLSDPKRSIEATLSAMMRTSHLGEAGPHPVVASAARELLNKSDNERSGVLSTAMSFLGLYRDPVVATVTSRCEWRINDLLEGDRPVSLYFVIPPSDISRTKPLIRLILNQIGRRLTENLSGRDLPGRPVGDADITDGSGADQRIQRLHCFLDRGDRIGDIVALRLPEHEAMLLATRGYLPFGVPLLKPVAALAGQSVCRIGVHVTIDGKSVGDAKTIDHRGRKLPVWQGCQRLEPGQVFAMNAAVPTSLDGRYFGVLSMDTVIGRAVPVHVRTGEAEQPPSHFDPLPDLRDPVRERPLLGPPMMPVKPGEPPIE